MSSSDEVPPSVDPDFEALFRQAPAGSLTPASTRADSPVERPADARVDAATDEPADQPVDESPPAPSPIPSATMSDTGRLFRSQGVTGDTSAVLALSTVQSLRLRTMKRSDTEEPAAPAVPAPAAEGAGASAPGQPHEPTTSRRAQRRRAAAAPSTEGLPARMCYLIIIGVTLVVAFINAFLASGDISWPTGLAMLAATVFCALKVRREDDIVPVITPALAFFLTALTAAQLFLGSAERSLVNRAVVVFFTLANNWMWILGTTVIALAIMLVRRRRG